MISEEVSENEKLMKNKKKEISYLEVPGSSTSLN